MIPNKNSNNKSKSNLENHKTSILLVDDDPNFREAIKTMLLHYGYSVDEAYDGVHAFDKIQNQKYDFMLADLMMPKMLGTELVKKVSSLHPDLKIIMITGVSSSLGIEDFSITPVQKYLYGSLSKPFEIKDLINLLKLS